MPNSTLPTGYFTISTYAIYSSNQYSVDSSSKNGLFNATAGSVLVPVVLPSSNITYQTTKYTITFTVNNPIQIGGTVEVTFPSEIDIVNTTYSQTT